MSAKKQSSHSLQQQMQLQKRTCQLCMLSAVVVKRGIALLEREHKYDEALHYLGLLLQAPGLRYSPHRPAYWLRTLLDRTHLNR